MNTDVLFKAKSETLSVIKEEAEKNLTGIQHAEDVITNKSNTLMQILISVFLIISGFIIKSFSDNDYSELFYVSIPLAFLLGYVVFKLYKNVLPVKSAISGCEPNQLVQADMITGNDSTDTRNIVVNRIYNLQNDIDIAIESHSIRYNRFKMSNTILLTGLGVILGLSIIFLLSRSFLPFLNAC